jgi:hypothetical protein
MHHILFYYLHNQFKLGTTCRNKGVFEVSHWLENTAIGTHKGTVAPSGLLSEPPATGSQSLLLAPLGSNLTDAATAKQCRTTCNKSSFFFMMVY